MLTIESPQPLVPVTLKLTVNARGDLILTTLPVADLETTVEGELRVLPQVGFGLGFSTQFILIGTGADQTQQGQIRFRQSDGSSLLTILSGFLDSQFSYEIDSDGASILSEDGAEISDIILDPDNALVSEIVVNVGNQLKLSPVVIDSNGQVRQDIPVQFLSLDEAAAPIDDQGRIQGAEAGFSTLTAQVGGILAVATITVVDVQPGPPGFGIEGNLARSSWPFLLQQPGESDDPAGPDLDRIPGNLRRKGGGGGSRECDSAGISLQGSALRGCRSGARQPVSGRQ